MNGQEAEYFAKLLDNIASGRMTYCEECGETEILDASACPECGAETVPYTLEDYLNDFWYNDEFRIFSDDVDTVRDGAVMIACGGPNIWVDTEKRNVTVYWWGSEESAPIAEDTADQIREILQTVYDCVRGA